MKALVHSSVFWVAVVQALVAVIIIFTSTFPDANWAGILLLIKSFLDMYLRTQTSQPIGSVLPK